MTPSEILTQARSRYNATGDTFFSDTELLSLIYDACLDLARECLLIEATYTTSTVASQQEYSYPTSTIAIKRVTYAGVKLDRINLREDDDITGFNQSTTDTGTPAYYYIWNRVISLRPIPAAVGTLKIWSYNEPSAVTIASTLEIPTQFHMEIVNYLLSEIAAKDSNQTLADYYLTKWEKARIAAKRWAQKKSRGDSFNVVQNEEW